MSSLQPSEESVTLVSLLQKSLHKVIYLRVSTVVGGEREDQRVLMASIQKFQSNCVPILVREESRPSSVSALLLLCWIL